ncbi:hypothetical protein [Thermodesulfovibrio yellowstonii]|uniref:ribonuclease toxin HepT-like protein n=1 Tax=Thermodesulfovibrio yellowstonii TaxID=28262 RepID=UPI0024B39153|nr:hypothetical protein [Thermodesulfovibrio yellowstonii]MDI6865087.1 hypothetical protein [Thermodesulfovibrio yellowstonii]
MKERIAILKSEIERDTERLNRLFRRFSASYREFEKTGEYSKMIESAFYINQIYTGFERIFTSIAKTFENTIEDDYWHKSILERMNLKIEGLRPALISNQSFQYLNELRAFRHFFRHAYDVDIDREKFKIVAEKALKIKERYRSEINKFLKFLDELLK